MTKRKALIEYTIGRWSGEYIFWDKIWCTRMVEDEDGLHFYNGTKKFCKIKDGEYIDWKIEADMPQIVDIPTRNSQGKTVIEIGKAVKK